jgi:glycosyltransferase involved in cell wall biosynthesis
MLEISRTPNRSDNEVTVGMVSTFPPTRCGIARFASTFIEAMSSTYPNIRFEVVRLRRWGEVPFAARPVVMEIDPNIPVSIRAAARRLGRYDVAIVQHEFGIYGEDDGASVVDLVSAIPVPCIVVLHTVIPDPTPRQLDIIKRLGKESSVLVALCQSAADLLEEKYSVPAEKIEVIPHGTNWTPQAPNDPPRRRLITWGLLGPGKGIERALLAVARLKDLDPPVNYRIVGRTHPVVLARSGKSYREMLEGMVRDLELENVVEFVDRYLDEPELMELVRTSDLVVVPYDNHVQVSSGVIADAVGLGRPVVATRFPHAVEMLGDGAGEVVDHDPEALAQAIRRLLEDPNRYVEATKLAAAGSEKLNWVTVAGQYAHLIQDLAPALATA